MLGLIATVLSLAMTIAVRTGLSLAKFEHYLLGMFSQYVITKYIGLTQVSLSFVLYIMNHAVIGCDYHTVWAEQTISSCYTQCYHLASNSSISVACVDIPFSVYIKCIFSVAVYIYHFRCISSVYSV